LEKKQKGVDGQGNLDDSTCIRHGETKTGDETMNYKTVKSQIIEVTSKPNDVQLDEMVGMVLSGEYDVSSVVDCFFCGELQSQGDY